MNKYIFIFLLILTQKLTFAQLSTKIGGQIGIQFNLGSHIQQIGFFAKSFYAPNIIQLNLGSSFTFNLKSYGNRLKMWESRTYIGLIGLGGKRECEIDFQLDGLNHQTNFNHAIGFNYLFYFDNRKTSQLSGGWSLRYNQFSIQFENDVFGGQSKDRFRSGVLQFNILNQQHKFSIGTYIWTGETGNSKWIKTPQKNCPNGYRNLEETLFGKTSHGILYAGYQNNFIMYNFAHIKIGIDSEQVRHIIQNKITHDLIFLPKRIPRNTPHYPRLDENGCAIFEKKKKRKDKLYFQLNLNDNWSN
jgi:hypothetical protein